jgi:hypothetical protein
MCGHRCDYFSECDFLKELFCIQRLVFTANEMYLTFLPFCWHDASGVQALVFFFFLKCKWHCDKIEEH